MTHNPKAQFQQNPEDRQVWRNLVSTPVFHRAATHAFAICATSGLSAAELHGASVFLHIIMNLSEDEQKQQPLPVRSLTSYDEPPKP